MLWIGQVPKFEGGGEQIMQKCKQVYDTCSVISIEQMVKIVKFQNNPSRLTDVCRENASKWDNFLS